MNLANTISRSISKKLSVQKKPGCTSVLSLATAAVATSIYTGKLTWNLKITQLKRKIMFQTSIFGFHVFQGVI